MPRVIAALSAAWCLFVGAALPSRAAAQSWNDPRTLELVRRAIDRRALQLADTGLLDYTASAHGYVTFLAQLGEGLAEPPKVVKSDELALEVYWRTPNLSKQQIVGRRDTLLLPTDINYHRDHLGIVQNNFPSIIRLGEGDEVRDVPHPLSTIGFGVYDFAIRDSLTIRLVNLDVQVFRVDVRPKDPSQARLVGALYVDRGSAQVVKMTFSFTRAAFLDKELENISVSLESALYETRWWLPYHQEIEIQRGGSWLEFPARGIIRGRWEICCYRINEGVAQTMFVGPEIVQAPLAVTRAHVFPGRIMDSLPQGVRAASDTTVRRVQEEIRQLVRAEALERVRGTTVTFPRVSDVVRFNRVEGLAVGGGFRTRLGAGVQATLKGRWGFDDHEPKGELRLGVQRASGVGLSVFGARQYREAGDVQETLLMRNTFAAQEFGSDYTDLYDVRAVGVALEYAKPSGGGVRLEVTREHQGGLEVHTTPAFGAFEPTIDAWPLSATRASFAFDGMPVHAPGGFLVTPRVELRGQLATRRDAAEGRSRSVRASGTLAAERQVGRRDRLVLWTSAAVVSGSSSDGGGVPPQELVRFGGPVSGPGYDYHSLVGRGAVAQHVEWQTHVPFPSFQIGRFGQSPGAMTLAPYGHAVYLARPEEGSGVASGWYPSVGLAGIVFFDLLRVEAARGLRDGRWTFSFDVSGEFWRVL